MLIKYQLKALFWPSLGVFWTLNLWGNQQIPPNVFCKMIKTTTRGKKKRILYSGKKAERNIWSREIKRVPSCAISLLMMWKWSRAVAFSCNGQWAAENIPSAKRFKNWFVWQDISQCFLSFLHLSMSKHLLMASTLPNFAAHCMDMRIRMNVVCR